VAVEAREGVRTVGETPVDATVGLVIGFGSVGHKHARSLADLVPELVIADTNGPAREAAGAAHPGSTVVACLEELDRAGLPWSAVVAVVAAWGPAHASLFHQLADRGVRHVLCEKPLAASVADAFAMAERAEREGIRLSVHHYFRYAGAVPSLRALLDDHGLGPPVSMSVTGGAACLVTNGLHWLDFATELFGEPPGAVVSDARGKAINPRSPDLELYGGAATWEFGAGRRLTMDLSLDSSVAMEARVYARDAALDLDENLNARLRRRDPRAVERFPAMTRTGPARDVIFEGVLPGTLPYAEGMRRALEEVRSLAAPLCPGRAGAVAVSGLVGALVSSREGRRVALPIDPASVWGREHWPIS
jgi:predicted dehydrogenase